MLNWPEERAAEGDGTPSWCQPGSNVCLDFHGDPAAALVVYSDGNHHMALGECLERFLAVYNERLLKWTAPYPGAHETLAELGTRLMLAMLTNKPLEATRRILAGLDLARYFPEACVVGGDGPFPRKPDPAGLQHLAAVAGVPPGDVLLVGDSVIDWRTARAAGARACVARYGFGFEGFPVGDLGPDDQVVDEMPALLALL